LTVKDQANMHQVI